MFNPFYALARIFGFNSRRLEIQPGMDLGRNDPCFCGSGKKFKKCHLKDLEAARSKAEMQQRIAKIQSELGQIPPKGNEAYIAERGLAQIGEIVEGQKRKR